MDSANEGERRHAHFITRGAIFSSSVIAAVPHIDQTIKILILCKITCYNWKCVNPNQSGSWLRTYYWIQTIRWFSFRDWKPLPRKRVAFPSQHWVLHLSYRPGLSFCFKQNITHLIKEWVCLSCCLSYAGVLCSSGFIKHLVLHSVCGLCCK